jgi:hypothetical protein
LAAILTVGVLSIGAGCGDGKVRVRGTASFDGKPIDQGMISFDPADGRGPNTGGEIREGHFDLANEARATPGKKIVRIRAFRSTGRKIESGPPAPPGTLVDEIQPFIPARYNESSTLSADILPGKVNEVNFDLRGSNRPSP